MKTSAKEGVKNCGLIGVAIAFLFAAVPISIQVASADGGKHLTAEQKKVEDCGVLNVRNRQDDNFSKRVSTVRKQLGSDSREN